jgi:N-acetylneuraminic acid mutarotase
MKNLTNLIILLVISIFYSCGPLKFKRIKDTPHNFPNPSNAVGGRFGTHTDSLYYVFGGIRNGIQQNEILKYNKQINNWQILNLRLPKAVSHATINRLQDGSLYMIGGANTGTLNRTYTTEAIVNKISFINNNIVIQPKRAIPDDIDDSSFKGISSHTSIAINNNIFVFGGKRSNNNGSHFSTKDNKKIYNYDVMNDSWIALSTSLNLPVYNGYIIYKNNYLYIFDGNLNDSGKFNIQILLYNNNNISYLNTFEIEPPLYPFNNIPFIHTIDNNNLQKTYHYPINGSCRIYIDNFNNNNLPSAANNYHFKIEYSDFEFPTELENSRVGTSINGLNSESLLSVSDWLILTPRKFGNFFATPN